MTAVASCQVDDRAVVCDAECQSGVSSESGGVANVASGGATASASGGAQVMAGGASAGGASGGKASAGATTQAGASALGGSANSAGGAGNGGASAGAINASSGGSPTRRTDCVGSVASGTDPVVDDFADGDLAARFVEGRQGYWIHMRSDVTGAPAPSVLLEQSNYYLSLAGALVTGSQYPWANLKVELRAIGTSAASASCVYDASKYHGLRFRARGAPVRFSVEMDLNIPAVNNYGAPGACTATPEADCYARNGALVPLTASWASYEYTWAMLTPSYISSWNPPFSAARLVGIYFEAVPETTSATVPAYAFDLDDVEFF
ncbi:MAG: hypothetical protein QM756_33895 [Polyangiaceae bacterium]